MRLRTTLDVASLEHSAVESIAAVALTAGVARPFQIGLRQLKSVFVAIGQTS